ncbi:hypothetical protein WR25_16902 isoform A [Diploscapter pachys]|uniref:Troponin T n=1 Tax=Diploscapter pachys TaxID=2018661 RepID=A0A2A2LJT6_9BILA|nr:hypothetical protein WR25_16902 isoform A [Diploscapter pachys]
MSYEERRRTEREKEEEEMRKLKEKKERRKLEREQEEREMEEKRREAEERRKQEEEERKAVQEMERKKKEEEREKRAKLTGAAFPAGGGTGGRSFTIQKKNREAKDEKFGNIVQAKQEMGMTKEQQEEAKRNYMNAIQKGIPEVDEVPASELKTKIKELHQRIVKGEGFKYDLEKRHERQEYDMRELTERQRQVTRNSALRKGIDPAEAGNSRYPPKVQIVSKYDRQIDRRNFRERRSMFETKSAYPVFPGLPPPPALYEKVIKEIGGEKEDEEVRTIVFFNNH